ncbi:MAG: ABC transporter permease [Chitinophagaceae bacterium]|nr:ABC transporter permease [Chitinophagaceae bacterium]MCW5904020.1 ABC transporter permease [Chitinophagaceae bacterium]
MNFLFAWRYFKSKKSTNAVNIIAYISIVAIMVGTIALILVLSVFNGFESLVKNLYSDFYADAKIIPTTGKILYFNTEQINTIQQDKQVAYVSFVVEEKALLKNGDYQSTVIVKGVDNNYSAVSGVPNHIVRGSFNTGTTDAPQIVIGGGIENAVGIYIGAEYLVLPTLYLPNKKALNFTNLNDAFFSFNVLPSGVFNIQQEFDNKFIFTNISFLQFMLDMDNSQYSYAVLKLHAKSDREAKKITEQLQKKLGNQFIIQTRYEQNKSLYSIMQIEKWVIYGILSLILVVAAFNMIGSLTMLVLEKQKDIAILKAMGATDNTIQYIFISNGLILALIGSSIGIALASFICWLQIKFKLLKLGGSFVVDYYPVEMRLQDFVLVILTVFIVLFIASYIPASKAGKQKLSLKS